MVTIAGSLSSIVCRPPSTSRVTSTLVAVDLDLRGEGALRPAEQRGQHLAGLVGVVVDRLLAEDDEARLLGLDDALQDLGDASGSTASSVLTRMRAVGAHGERGAQRLLRLRRPDRDDDDLVGLAGFLQAERLLDGDFVERVHRHLHVGEFDARAVRP